MSDTLCQKCKGRGWLREPDASGNRDGADPCTCNPQPRERTDTERLKELAEASRVIQDRFDDGTYILLRALKLTTEISRWAEAIDAAIDAEEGEG